MNCPKCGWPQIDDAAKLRKCQRQKREMWKALSARCNLNVWKGLGLYRLCGIHGLGKPMNKCTHRNCPLLKGKVKK